MMCKVGIYLVVDFPDRGRFLEAVELCERMGVDFLEVGFPFSDPVADGDVIEKAAMDVLKKESTPDFIDALHRARKLFSRRMYVMTYANVAYGYSLDRFADSISEADSVILADVPFVESRRFRKVFKKYGLGFVSFVTPESSQRDIDAIKREANDFIYFVSVLGTTGSEFFLDEQTVEKILYCKNGFSKDVIIGFGIKTKADISRACKYADGVVIGTQAVLAVEKGEFGSFLKAILE